MSEHSPSISIDLGLADVLRSIPDVIGVKHGTFLNRIKAQAQQANLKQAQANLAILREVGAYVQKLRFGTWRVEGVCKKL